MRDSKLRPLWCIPAPKNAVIDSHSDINDRFGAKNRRSGVGRQDPLAARSAKDRYRSFAAIQKTPLRTRGREGEILKTCRAATLGGVPGSKEQFGAALSAAWTWGFAK